MVRFLFLFSRKCFVFYSGYYWCTRIEKREKKKEKKKKKEEKKERKKERKKLGPCGQFKTHS
jgi:hypothetical protein